MWQLIKAITDNIWDFALHLFNDFSNLVETNAELLIVFSFLIILFYIIEFITAMLFSKEAISELFSIRNVIIGLVLLVSVSFIYQDELKLDSRTIYGNTIIPSINGQTYDIRGSSANLVDILISTDDFQGDVGILTKAWDTLIDEEILFVGIIITLLVVLLERMFGITKMVMEYSKPTINKNKGSFKTNSPSFNNRPSSRSRART